MSRPALPPQEQKEFLTALYNLCDQFGVDCLCLGRMISLEIPYTVLELRIREEIQQGKNPLIQ